MEEVKKMCPDCGDKDYTTSISIDNPGFGIDRYRIVWVTCKKCGCKWHILSHKCII